jgi:hypothetical protein
MILNEGVRLRSVVRRTNRTLGALVLNCAKVDGRRVCEVPYALESIGVCYNSTYYYY